MPETSSWYTTIGLVAYLALFASVGILFLFVNLLVGKFLRPANPIAEKLEIYECGEPTIGSSFVQFDLRFYVVALVFIVFDVEVAFLFPWATAFGKATHLADERLPVVAASANGGVELTPDAKALHIELGLPDAGVSATNPAQATREIREGSRNFATFAASAMAVFFVVLLIGYAYEWRTGAYDWVRALTQERRAEVAAAPPPAAEVTEEELVEV
jgi:NADH-quinone oxidoreductase subunit A